MIKKIGLGVFGLLLIIFIFLFIVSPGKTSPIVDGIGNEIPNSIATIEKPIIGGVPQGIIIRGENIMNPVLLYVHGGPGGPSYPMYKNELKKLEKIFTVCYWEQRGAGMSYSENIPVASMNLNQLVDDAAGVTRYLMNKFQKQKIYILGHSWGTLLSSFTIHKYPELYFAYIGIGQIANTYLSEKESYQFVTEEAKNRNDKNAEIEISELKFPDVKASGQEWYDYYMIQRKYVLEYGGARYRQSRSYNDIRKAVLFCREYTIRDKMNYSAGAIFSQIHLDSYMINVNLNNDLTEQYIPVYIFQGLHDHQTSYPIAKEYFDHLKAPVKKFYTFNNSAHSPHIEQYDEFEKIVKTDILSIQ